VTTVTTTQDDAVWMLDVMLGLEITPVIARGWGIDALVGHQTREHRDLDVLVPEPFVDPLVTALSEASFSITTDWLPVRIELTDDRAQRRIDIHPAFDDGRQGWWQQGFDGHRFESPQETLTDGTIGGRAVHCFTAAKQLELHQSSPHRPGDVRDIAVLHRLTAR
jgi:lincosamide nucleotidyltransferase A/C/D/E